jgi:hypothetical protein
MIHRLADKKGCPVSFIVRFSCISSHSYWETEADLENYRNSNFYDVWTFTKKLFNDKPEAWSVDKLVTFGLKFKVEQL